MGTERSAPSSHGNTVRVEKPSVDTGAVTHNKKERLATFPDQEKKRRSMLDYERTTTIQIQLVLEQNKIQAHRQWAACAVLFTISSYHENCANRVQKKGIQGQALAPVRCMFGARKVQQGFLVAAKPI